VDREDMPDRDYPNALVYRWVDPYTCLSSNPDLASPMPAGRPP
jgi:hypothetical protein